MRIIDWLKGDLQHWRIRAEIAEGKLSDAERNLDEAEARVAAEKDRVTLWIKHWRIMLNDLMKAKRDSAQMQEELDMLRASVSVTLTQGE